MFSKMFFGLRTPCSWSVVMEVSLSSKNTDTTTQQAAGNRMRDSNTKGHRDVDELSNVDHVVTSAKPSQFEAQLFFFLKIMKL